MSLAQGNNTPTRPRIEPGSPDPESDALTTRPVRTPAAGFEQCGDRKISYCTSSIEQVIFIITLGALRSAGLFI